jgi:hypothetical protein
MVFKTPFKNPPRRGPLLELVRLGGKVCDTVILKFMFECQDKTDACRPRLFLERFKAARNEKRMNGLDTERKAAVTAVMGKTKVNAFQ